MGAINVQAGPPKTPPTFPAITWRDTMSKTTPVAVNAASVIVTSRCGNATTRLVRSPAPSRRL